MASRSRYTSPAILLHWLIAALVVVMISLGYFMTGLERNTTERAFFLNLHKSLGVLTLAVVLVRIGWRLRHEPPPLPDAVPRWQRRTSVLSHHLLYACLLLQPLTGYLTSSFGKHGITFFGIPLPSFGWEDMSLREAFAGAHRTIVVAFLVLIGIHVLAALKHAFVDRDRVFSRMLPYC